MEIKVERELLYRIRETLIAASKADGIRGTKWSDTQIDPVVGSLDALLREFVNQGKESTAGDVPWAGEVSDVDRG